MKNIEELEQGTNIDKNTLINLIYKRLESKGYNTILPHIKNVVEILFDELQKRLFSGKNFIIGGLGKFIFKKMPSRAYFNFQTNKVEKSVGNKLIRFKLNEKLRLILLENLDTERTFNKEINNEKIK